MKLSKKVWFLIAAGVAVLLILICLICMLCVLIAVSVAGLVILCICATFLSAEMVLAVLYGVYCLSCGGGDSRKEEPPQQ